MKLNMFLIHYNWCASCMRRWGCADRAWHFNIARCQPRVFARFSAHTFRNM